MKCGTSSLHYYLSQHPSISMSTPKELNFFLSSIEDGKNPKVQGRNFEQGIDWYKSHFDPTCYARGESSPAYMDPRHLGVAKRMSEVVPDATLIVLTRDPFERAVSEFRHRVATGEETRPLEVAVLDPTSSYIALSRYHACLQSFYDYFGPGKILRFRQEDLDGDTRAVVEKVMAALGVESSVQIEDIKKRINTAAGRGTIHRFLSLGKGTTIRSWVARIIPNRWKYKLDVLSRQSTKPPKQNDSPIDSLIDIRHEFLELLGDDPISLLDDVQSGRLVEGFTLR